MTTSITLIVAALQAIDSERDYQDSFWPENAPADPRPLSIGEDILLIEEYHSRAVEQESIGNSALDMVRKIAGIAVRCLENHGSSTPGVPGMMGRTEVYKRICDSLKPWLDARDHDPAEPIDSVTVELGRIHQMVLMARSKWASARRPEVEALQWIAQIASTTVRCMMSHGAPCRQR